MANDLNCPYVPDRDILLDGGGRVEIVWYVDYTCRHTRRIRDIVRRSPQRFGTQSTAIVVRFIVPDDDTRGAELAARAAIAAHRQGRFADMNRALFDHRPSYTQTQLEGLATYLGLDLPQFRADMVDAQTDAKLDFDRWALGRTSHLHMPLIFIDGRFYDGAWDEDALLDAIEKPLGVRIANVGGDFLHWAASAGLVLILATLAALLASNLGWHDAYERLRATDFTLSFGDNSFALPLEVWINDGLMALFFLLVGIEIKRELIIGELSTWDRAILPIIAAVGGMVVPAGIYIAVNWGGAYTHGWGVPMATDIAFTLGIMALLGSRVPASLKIFVSALAIADDLGAILVIALFYGEGFHLEPFVFAAGVLALMVVLNAGRVYNRMPYMLLGVVLWFYIHQSGLHATLAGVLTAAALPLRRPADGRGVAAQAEAIVEGEDEPERMGDTAVRRLLNAVERLREPGFHLQESLEAYSNYLILPLFAFFNTGLLIIGSTFSPMAPQSLGVMLGLFLGKPLGIVGIVWIATRLGWARLSSEISWTQMIGAGFLAGVGFTMSIFISAAAFDGAETEGVKLAVLLASTCAAVVGSLILWHAPKIGSKHAK